ncbi:hypothetical protein KHO57_gp017 [Mycobacterium phage Phabba]|uniref:Uncharacterized protein n=1 Tax=Mycobacterium phage Phabba TaxID=2027899 RepID=A0A249XS64_9CAUD|nr:hypothetical protein KHO57_gp017 [Mycobacterium phage Phabba]ASZ74592.1 hypothetical protein SEA_PHABBA_17 [Mycobacterium phage Phabba]
MNWAGMFGVLAGAAGTVAFVTGLVNPFFEDAYKRKIMLIAFAVCVLFTTLAVGVA